MYQAETVERLAAGFRRELLALLNGDAPPLAAPQPAAPRSTAAAL